MSDREMAKAEVAFLQLFRAMRTRVTDLLRADPVCNGRVGGTTMDMIGEIAGMGGLSPVQALALGRVQERQDTIAFLEGRKRAAETIAEKNPDQADRARDFAQQITVEIESLLQGLHEEAGALPRFAAEETAA